MSALNLLLVIWLAIQHKMATRSVWRIYFALFTIQNTTNSAQQTTCFDIDTGIPTFSFQWQLQYPFLGETTQNVLGVSKPRGQKNQRRGHLSPTNKNVFTRENEQTR